ncbi:cell envelope biogenesis protein OmpA [Chitinophaga silvatica]|uniref:Cell envelope biogenesis protein OmpA n=1 Tax=Chitinophaga silvatica TaxID=2282649 RepID=A0A3E1YH55_9BACT|nr:carboxypeptidase regulatory-like domain-containing protein [Chitinophaga silvatica]RFS26684.1 cell envelope biogenesis protein OmpA [Chitinophaga silvatica]
MLKKKALLFLLCLFLLPLAMMAQVTTGSVTGTVKGPDGKGIEGASITLVHQPSGTRYMNRTLRNGSFTLSSVRIGGPYLLKVNYIGFKPQTVEGFTVLLGEPYDVVINLGSDTKELAGITISSTSVKRKGATEKSGAATVIDSRMLASLPSYNRSITDFTKLTPQSNGGNSFAGRSGYYNNLKVDGANLNNSFGLSTDPLPGGGASPISLDAFDEISVNIAPVDVRQSGFTGAGINAVTKSGTNEFHGTVYGFYRDQSFNGRNVGDLKLDPATSSSKKSYGGSIGGPIIKNKLFFFVNGEYEINSGSRITNYVATGSTNSGNISSTPIDSLAKLATYLKEKYGYDPGVYDNYPTAAKSNYKYIAKVDWNINNHNKLTAKYSDFVSNEDPSSINASSIIGGGGFSLPGTTSSLSTLPNSRLSNKSMVFSNSVYGFKHTVKTGTLELNSTYGKISNSLLLTNSKVQDTRITNSAAFPFVEIFDGTTIPHNYMSFGYEPYSFNNDVINKVWSVTDNFSYYTGKHSLTAGFSYEYQMVGNMFMPGAQSYYIYNSLSDFMADNPPLYYSYAYSMVPGKSAVYSAELKYGQASLYAQDEIKVNNRLKVTLGLRADKPVYLENALENPAITALTFPDKDGNMTHYNGQWPSPRVTLSPRIGARWDVLGDKSLIIRGSTGIFNGMGPFVWLTNMPTNSGMYQNSVALKNTNPDDLEQLNKMKFDPKVDAYSKLFPPVAGTSIPTNIVMVDPNFKFPQIFRTDLAIDKNLGNGYSFTIEGLITKDINAVRMRNANLKEATGILNGPDNRPRYVSTLNTDRYIYPNIGSAVILENTNKGYSYALTTQLNKAFAKGFYGSVAYTYTKAKDISGNSGSQAYSIWNSNATVGTSNDLELNPSSSVSRHRIVSMLSYRFEYLKHAATTVSLIYQGAPSGNITYRINGDLNGDGNNQDLMYVPKKATELLFDPYSATVNGVTYTFTPEQQAAALDKFINNSPYLSKRRGQYTERNGGIMPWYNDVAARFLQEFYIKSGKTRHTLQFSADILNLPNLLNKYWGIQKATTTTQPLALKNINAEGVPVYRMQNNNGVLYTTPTQNVNSGSSTWSMQLGARYSF